jgi:ApaG protein
MFVYQYKVVIENVGTERARLISRHWIVRDAHGETREVKGPGVVGEHPDLAPGEQFEYVSGCHLVTEWGTMEGTYRMRRPDGSEFEAEIGRFFLAPNAAPITSMEGS